jgi:hypothetical protein
MNIAEKVDRFVSAMNSVHMSCRRTPNQLHKRTTRHAYNIAGIGCFAILTDKFLKKRYIGQNSSFETLVHDFFLICQTGKFLLLIANYLNTIFFFKYAECTGMYAVCTGMYAVCTGLYAECR